MNIIPAETQASINMALDELARNNESHISYYFRHRIYETFMSVNISGGEVIFKRLALITARYVLPIWQASFSTNMTPIALMEKMDWYLGNPTKYLNSLREEADAFWVHMEKLGSASNALEFENALYAGETVAEAALEVLGKIPYKNLVIEKTDTDVNLDVWCGDTAFWAVNAFAGRYGTLKADQKKYDFFWKWWLKNAIPTAFEAL